MFCFKEKETFYIPIFRFQSAFKYIPVMFLKHGSDMYHTGRILLYVGQRHLTLLKQWLINCKYVQIVYSFIFQYINNKKNLSLGLLNPGSLGTGHDEFYAAVEKHGVDILAINETWLRSGEEARAPAPPGYRLRHVPRPEGVRSRGGGVGFYIRRGIYVRQLLHPQAVSVEQMWISVSVNGCKIAIGTAYRPPWFNVDTFFDALTESICSFSKFDQILLLGDFNINLLALDSVNVKKFNEFQRCINLEQNVKVATHFTEHSETLIDVVCSSNIKVSNVCVDYIPELSAHAFVSCELSVKKPKLPPRWIFYRPLKDIDIGKFNADVETIPWEQLVDGNIEVAEAVLAFNSYIVGLFDSHAPITKTFIKEQNPPWFTYTVKKMMKLRNEAHVKSRITKRECDKVYYKELKRLVSAALFSEKAAYFQHHINQRSRNPRALWKNIKKHIDFHKKHSDLPPSIGDANQINKHFLNIPGNAEVDETELSFFASNRYSPAVFHLHTVDCNTVLNIIKSISTNAQGVDGISLDMLMLTLPRTLPILTSIINKSIQSGVVPDIWKEAIVKPIPKVSQPTDMKDLRPISILPLMSKIIEKVVSMQMVHFLEEHKILPSKQSGFRTGYSTSTLLLDVIDDVLGAQDVGNGTILVLLDYSRAFDSINIRLLISKLVYYGFDETAINWLTSYLNGRTQRVEVCRDSVDTKDMSDAAPVGRGVPQGSILGPLLYILYASDITNSIKNCKFHLYADDLQVYISFKPSETARGVDLLNEDLERIAQWSDKNNLTINPDKSKFLILGTKSQIQNIKSSDPIIKIRDSYVEQRDEVRNLGVQMDGRLKFENHILEIVRNCYYRLKVLYKIRQYLSTELRVYFCESLILSKLNYADTVFGSCLLARTKKLIQRVQNACARFCFPIPRRAHVSPYINRSGLLNMDSRYKYHFASLLFGIIKHRKPCYLFEKLNFSQRPVRTVCKLAYTQHTTAAFRGSFRHAATKCWNDIPPPIRNSQSRNCFKINFKAYLLDLQKK